MDNGAIRDIHKQLTRITEPLRTSEVQQQHPAIYNAVDLLDRALNKVTRVPHKPVLQQDEYFCSECGCRWDNHEPEPQTSCTPGPTLDEQIAEVKNRIDAIENTGRITGREGPEYTRLNKQLLKLRALKEGEDNGT